MPRGAVLVALDQVPGATSVASYPEDYERLEAVLVPERDRTHPLYFAYSVDMPVSEIGARLEPISPMIPRPGNSLPRRTPK
jgi:hypothetical protein